MKMRLWGLSFAALAAAACGDDSMSDVDGGSRFRPTSDGALDADGARDADASDATVDASPDAEPPADGNLRDVIAIAAGNRHACALVADGTVYCWGANQASQLGDGLYAARPWASEATALGDEVSAIATGGFHTCVIGGDDDELRCVGANESGQTMGTDGVTHDEAVTFGEDFDEVVAGAKHTCVRAGNDVSCFGANDFRQLGRAGGDLSMPAPVEAASDDIVQLAAGDAHTCARRSGGEIECWGGNFVCQLGDVPSSPREPLAPVDYYEVLDVATVVATGGAHTAVIDTEGNLLSWGDNSSAQLPASAATWKPAPEIRVSDVRLIALGDRHSCAVFDDDAVRCWGSNTHNQLGPVDAEAADEPIEIEGIENVTALAAGTGFTCALLEDTTVHCWGRNDFGQLGDGTTNRRSAPTQVIVR